ncbi:unnamed protein product [Boreogadus saida]
MFKALYHGITSKHLHQPQRRELKQAFYMPFTLLHLLCGLYYHDIPASEMKGPLIITTLLPYNIPLHRAQPASAS